LKGKYQCSPIEEKQKELWGWDTAAAGMRGIH